MNILEYFESLDKTIFLDINHNMANPLFDFVFPPLRYLTYIFWLSLIIYFLTRNEKKLALLMTVGIIGGMVFTYPLKLLIDRTRPYDQIESTRLLTPSETDPSFPSGHTELSFLASTVVSRFHPGYSKYLYAFSFIVALSRIYVGVHFPADTIAGLIVGVIIGKLVIMLAWRKKDILWPDKEETS
ncbi:MAG: phosphatase PAP2 family protein [Candidatus Methanoperedens sp.]|nr:phosphatase PAP2 family protein [Candidatus Methanoperedens sp.]MCE8424916.1 phosphatase PAP2 family protein [Candidatus Methanoperedens sp.]MCE8428704.1 phosphatase PAP2 family protein [Candidatus Methanoperedens sp.]